MQIYISDYEMKSDMKQQSPYEHNNIKNVSDYIYFM